MKLESEISHALYPTKGGGRIRIKKTHEAIQKILNNAHLVAKVGADAAENKKFLQKLSENLKWSGARDPFGTTPSASTERRSTARRSTARSRAIQRRERTVVLLRTADFGDMKAKRLPSIDILANVAASRRSTARRSTGRRSTARRWTATPSAQRG